MNHIYTSRKVIFLICWGLLSDTISTVTLSLEITEMYCAVASYLTNSLSASEVQFRAGSSIRESGGTVHPAAQIIVHPNYSTQTTDFDVAVVRVSNNIFANLNFWKRQIKLGSNTLNEAGNFFYKLKALQLTAALSLRNTTNLNYHMFRGNFRIRN